MKLPGLRILVLLLLPLSQLNGQTTDLKETFLEAESYFLFEEYNEALPLYLRLRRADPDNDDINYKIGICFLNDPYQKEKSIRYLELASQNVNPKYKENNFKETTAPLEAIFYLGNAYLVNNNIDKALENYHKFLEILDPDIYDVELVEEQIRTCLRATNLETKPVDFDRTNLGEVVNGRFTDKNPVISGDGNKLVYVSEQRFYDATFYSEKVDGKWSPPRNIIPELGVDGDVYPTSLSYDGTTMIIYRNDEFIGNLYRSEYVDGRWTTMEKLGDNINTKFWESHGTLSRDGNTLYFTSNRKGGFGGLDIYTAQLQEDGTWGEPVNLGETINTRYNDETPFLTEDERMLYFSSYGHYNMGGYDVFYSMKNDDGEWEVPVNMGYPINTTDDDLFYFPVNNGNNAFFSMYTQEGFGLHDLYYLDVYSENYPRMYLISGTLGSKEGGINEEDDLVLYLIDRETGDTVFTSRPDMETQEFALQAPKGQYDLLFRSLTFNDLVKNISIDETTDKAGLNILDTLQLELKPYEPVLLTGDESRILLVDSVYKARPGRKMKLKLRLIEPSMLIVEHTHDSLVIALDTFLVDKERFTVDLVPQEGENVVQLTMIQENGDKSVSVVVLEAEKGRPREQVIQDTVLVDPRNVPVDVPVEIEPEEVVETDDHRAVKAFIESVLPYVDEDTRKLLQGLDPAAEGIESVEELYDYLEQQGVDRQEINKLRVLNKTDNERDELYQLLLDYSDGSMRVYLEQLEIDSLDIMNADELFQYLNQKGETGELDTTEIDKLARIIASNRPDAEKARIELAELAKEPLKEYLENLDLDELEIDDKSDLVEYLVEQADISFAADLLLEMLPQWVIEEPVEEWYQHLLNTENKLLRKFLKKLDLEELGITTIAELNFYLLEHADEIGIEEDILTKLLLEEFYGFVSEKGTDMAGQEEEDEGGFGWLGILMILLGAGLLIFLFLIWRRRKKEEEQENTPVQ